MTLTLWKTTINDSNWILNDIQKPTKSNPTQNTNQVRWTCCIRAK
jgi:hypothetical protein